MAQLLSPMDHLKDLLIYYKMLKDIVAITSEEETHEVRPHLLAALADPLIAQGKAIRKHGKEGCVRKVL